MKKFFILCLMAFVMCVNANAQLQTRTIENARGYETIHKFWMGNAKIVKYNDGSYVLWGASNNQFEDTMHSIFLGDDKASAIQSLKDIGVLKKKFDGTIIVSGINNKETELYRYQGMTVFETKGVAGCSYALFYLKVDKAIADLQSN